MQDIWSYLKGAQKPIVLYGMGNGADKIIRVLELYGIEYSGVFASDDFVRDKTFHGFKIESYDRLKKKFGDMIVLLCFGSSRPEVIENVKRISSEQELYAPDVPVIGEGLFDCLYVSENRKELEWVYSLLSDEISKITFENVVKYKLSGKIEGLFECQVTANEPYNSFLTLGSNEHFIDLGAYNGDTVRDFVSRVDSFGSIIAVEPDKKNYKKLCLNTEGLENISCLNVGISDYCGEGGFAMNGGRNSVVAKGESNIPFATVDSITSGQKTTFIKMDVEGEEIAAIKGADNTIRSHRPKMMVSCYHRTDDLIYIPRAVFKIRSDYRLYIRHFESTLGWDTAYYFV